MTAHPALQPEHRLLLVVDEAAELLNQRSSRPAAPTGAVTRSPAATAAVAQLLADTAVVLARDGWGWEGSDDLTGPHTLTDALAVAAFPRGVDTDSDRPYETFVAAWQELDATTREVLGVSLPVFNATVAVDGDQVLGIVELTRRYLAC
jgi:hypothetical protein